MSQGLQLPIAASQGRAVISSGEDQLTKIIAAYLCDSDSENPFQNLGDVISIAFQNVDEEAEARMRVRIKQIFVKLSAQRRAKLATGYPKFSSRVGQQELVCDIVYINMETTEPKTLTLAFDPSGLARILNGA